MGDAESVPSGSRTAAQARMDGWMDGWMSLCCTENKRWAEKYEIPCDVDKIAHVASAGLGCSEGSRASGYFQEIPDSIWREKEKVTRQVLGLRVGLVAANRARSTPLSRQQADHWICVHC